MRTEDFSFAVQLANTMDWNMGELDFEFMAKLEPDGCFVLFEEQKPVGIATCISYGKTGWFGNLAVKEEHRKKGAGTFLVKHAVEYLREKGVETVGLYSYQHLTWFYESVGFKPHDESLVLSGKTFGYTPQKTLSKATQKDVPSLIQFDRTCFGSDRKKLLEPILLDKGNLCYFSVRNGEVAGFAAAKVYEEMAEVGPLVCRHDCREVAVALLKTILSATKDLDIYVCLPLKEKSLLETALSAGLREKSRLTRMFLGTVTAENCVYVPESLERG